MSWAVGVVSTLSIRIVSRRGSVDVLRRIPQGNQLYFQHVLQCLRQWHVDLRKLSSWRVLATRVVSLRLRWCRIGDHNCPHRLSMIGFDTAFLTMHNIGFFLTTKRFLCGI